MRASAAVFALVATTGALAQLPAGLSSILGGFSSQCQNTILGLATSGDLSSCLHIPQVLPILTTALTGNGSLIQPIDQLVAIECGQPGCSNSSLQTAAATFSAGCATDLARYNVTNATVSAVVAQYPLAREILCLQTTMPFNSTNATIPITSPTYNVTNGTAFCATSVLTEASSRIGQNITLPFLTSLYQSAMNGSISQYARYFNATDICNDCIFAAADLIGLPFPQIANVSLTSLGFNATNVTIQQALNSTCAAQNLAYSTNGTLPSTSRISIVNSTFPYTVRAGSMTYPGYNVSTNSMAAMRRNVADVKARWIGEHF